MTPRPGTEHERLTRQCLAALGSLHCELPRREKLVLKVMVENSFGLGLDVAMFGSNDQIALLADIDKGDVSNAISSLRRTRLVLPERAPPLHPFRKPMLYRVMPQALLHVAAERPANAVVAKVRADTAAWLVHANRCYPLQPDLLPPDPRLLDLALAEISRASALADDPVQNGEPKPGGGKPAGEAYPPEQPGRPGPALVPVLDPESGRWVQPEEMARMLQEALARPIEPPPPVGESPTGSGSSWRFSNYSCARDQISDDSDGDRLSPSGYPDEGMQGEPVGEFPTERGPSLVVRAAMLLAEFGEEWKPPTRGQEVFAELVCCMGTIVLANYTPWWLPRCMDPETRQDVLEAIATWKLSRLSPRHKPWRGGAWKNEFHRRQRERLAAAEKEGAAIDQSTQTPSLKISPGRSLHPPARR